MSKSIENRLKKGRASFSVNGRGVEVGDFTIDTTAVQIIDQEDGTITYTLFAERSETLDSILTNYVYQSYPDGSTAEFMFDYGVIINDIEEVVYDGSLSIVPFEGSAGLFGRTGCWPELVNVGSEYVCNITLCKGGGDHGPENSECVCLRSEYSCEPASQFCYERDIYEFNDCSNGGGGGTGANHPPNNGGGGQPGSSPDNPIFIYNHVPVEDPEPFYMDIVNCLAPYTLGVGTGVNTNS